MDGTLNFDHSTYGGPNNYFKSFEPTIRMSVTRPKWNMGEIFGLMFVICTLYVHAPQRFCLKSLHAIKIYPHIAF